MRLYLTTTPNKQKVPFNYQEKLTGAIHKWLGRNEYHEGTSLFSFSQLKNGQAKGKGLEFQNGAQWFISAWEDEFIKQIIKGIRENPDIAYGMKVKDVVIQETPNFEKIEKFNAASPIFIKRTEGNKQQYYYHTDEKADGLLVETLNTKMKKAGLEDETLEIKFDRNYPNSKIKMVEYNGIKIRASVCPVFIHAKPQTKAFAWNVGLGNNTGIGFGAII